MHWIHVLTRMDRSKRVVRINGKVSAHTFRFRPYFLFTICMNLYMPVSLGFAGSHSFLGVVVAIASYVSKVRILLR